MAGVSACTSLIVGPEGSGAGALAWGIVVGVVVLVGADN